MRIAYAVDAQRGEPVGWIGLYWERKDRYSDGLAELCDSLSLSEFSAVAFDPATGEAEVSSCGDVESAIQLIAASPQVVLLADPVALVDAAVVVRLWRVDDAQLPGALARAAIYTTPDYDSIQLRMRGVSGPQLRRVVEELISSSARVRPM